MDAVKDSERRRSHWGWGYADEALTPAAAREAAPGMAAHLGMGGADVEEPVGLADATLAAPRVRAPAALDAICTADVHDRAVHAWGRSYCDVVRGFRGDFEHAPDVVARPRDEREVEAVLEWATGANLAVVAYGGGTSVTGGVTCDVPARFDGAVSLDLGALDRVLEVDPVSRAARVQAGARGPVLERRLAEHGLTMRFYPQSFELSTLGGWIATRAGGHFATVETHVDDLVESVRAITPAAGTWESRRLPGSGAGVSPDRMLLGSEGILGIITEAWVRVRPRPRARASAGVRFASFSAGAEAVRALAQSGLRPSNCRLIDAEEAAFTLAGDGSAALLVLGFEGADPDELPVDELRARALRICGVHGGTADAPREGGGGGVDAWRAAFLRAPYLRDLMVMMGVLSETFETAITWERFPAFREQVIAATRDAVGPEAKVTCRLTHVYPDGPAPYFTVLAPARRGEEVAQWWAVKRAASDAILAAGGTITHHHSVGRDHRPWYDRQRPEPFAAALRAAKAALDPAGMLNPGVLLDPR